MTTPAEKNRIWCAATQKAAEDKLGRALTEEEEFKIWNQGSFLRIEQIDIAIYFAQSPEDIARHLADIPMPEAIPEEYTRRG
jgi:hypothetical protein